MTTAARGLCLFMILLLCAGCYTVRHWYDGPVVITNAKEIEGKPHIVKHFERHDRQLFWIFGIFPAGEPLNGIKMAAEEAGPDQAIVNFKLKDGMSTGDALLDGLIGIVGTYSVWVEGDVVQAAPAETEASAVQRTEPGAAESAGGDEEAAEANPAASHEDDGAAAD